MIPGKRNAGVGDLGGTMDALGHGLSRLVHGHGDNGADDRHGQVAARADAGVVRLERAEGPAVPGEGLVQIGAAGVEGLGLRRGRDGERAMDKAGTSPRGRTSSNAAGSLLAKLITYWR